MKHCNRSFEGNKDMEGIVLPSGLVKAWEWEEHLDTNNSKEVSGK